MAGLFELNYMRINNNMNQKPMLCIYQMNLYIVLNDLLQFLKYIEPRASISINFSSPQKNNNNKTL